MKLVHQASKEPKSEKVPRELRAPHKKFAIKRRGPSVIVKIVVANVVNVLLLVAIFYLLAQLPVVSKKIKELRSTQLAAQGSADAVIINSEIEKDKEKIDTLTGLLARDQEFIEFVEVVTALKSEGVVTDVIFPGGDPIVSPSLATLGGKGYPIILTFGGSLEAINSGLSRVTALPFILAPQNVELEINQASEENPGGTVLRLGVYLVVNDTFANN
ncbi:hypothetical protein A2803_04420 [Candidatus Woesebacteria bacterium RIFCSPHIGHO2_01_FULL_44_21]|uniref:Uncharacterized protein n=1 Tax=Candidatus Woesebacteria bacterium RIFCSPHIGHO2_01_FULL_44_21 TaxID=1802503 RepID=A0A1F7YYU3_9BACT|nr:MAG: hypothetical protein A2803_04420 [Candidatus Woesebacteria bacterium RIFCSPHIGHO2_01_FULL_44_21]OGM71317.1 MAG: hypothetical protein A2897_00785 [Candidatus Woesebacteria bacterium RIFCSPLOWO2_01_FULL_44_24b]